MVDKHITMRFNPHPTLLKFDRQLPTYNWLYPFELENQRIADPHTAFSQIPSRAGKRAIYIHVPFCDTLCSFCPFTRGEYTHEEELDRYVNSLIREIELKNVYEGIKAAPIDCIYFGGGSPSVLLPRHFYQLGEVLQRNFNLSQLQEFTMECEVKSVTLEKVKAWQDIGVTRTSFGVQTFHPLFRELFNLTATVEQIRRVQGWFSERFPTTNVDMIHSIAGQTLDDLLQDIDDVNTLGATTVDYYTLNNGVAQPRLHRAFAEHGLRSLSAHTRLSYRMYMNEYLRSLGFVPNSSYSFTRSTAQPGSPRVVIQRDSVFLYQETTYGYADDMIDAYGPGAQSYFGKTFVSNIENREQYAERLLGGQESGWCKAYHNPDDVSKGLVYFSYRGELEKARIDWTRVDESVRTALAQVVSDGLAVEESDRYTLTETGWLFAVNLMYMLMPWKYQEVLSQNIARRDATPSKQPDDVIFTPRKRTVVPVVSTSS